MHYDVIIIGAGPGGIFTAYEILQQKNEVKVAVFEAGHALDKRHCPIDGDKVKICIKCKSCSIMSGFGGAGAFSDGKYNITNDFGGTLYEYIGKAKAIELMEYVDANPGSVKCGVMSLTGLDGACVVAAFGDKIEASGYSEGSQLNSDIIGNHVGLACVGPAEVLSMIQSGDMKAIMTCTEERMTIKEYADVECAGELGVDCFYGPYRGIYCKNDMPQEAIDAFAAAAEKAVASSEFQEWAKTQGLDQRTGWMDPATYQAQWDADHEELTQLFG